MLALISFIVVIIGAINWFCIGLLQFDFVAGLFGSQSSIFSRIVYIAVGLGALVMLFNLIENKGKIKFNFRKKQKQNEEFHNTYQMNHNYAHNIESGKDYSYDKSNPENDKEHLKETQKNTEVIKDEDSYHCHNGSCDISNNDHSH